MASHVVDMLGMYELVIELQLSQCYLYGPRRGGGFRYRISNSKIWQYQISNIQGAQYLLFFSQQIEGCIQLGVVIPRQVPRLAIYRRQVVVWC